MPAAQIPEIYTVVGKIYRPGQFFYRILELVVADRNILADDFARQRTLAQTIQTARCVKIDIYPPARLILVEESLQRRKRTGLARGDRPNQR